MTLRSEKAKITLLGQLSERFLFALQGLGLTLCSGQAKSANCLFSLSIAQKYGERGWTSIALHPGACRERLRSIVLRYHSHGFQQSSLASADT